SRCRQTRSRGASSLPVAHANDLQLLLSGLCTVASGIVAVRTFDRPARRLAKARSGPFCFFVDVRHNRERTAHYGGVSPCPASTLICLHRQPNSAERLKQR